MKIGLYGGSFNPVHNAHVFVVENVLKKNIIDELWVIPCKDHPFSKNLASFDQRFKMLELAFQSFANVRISDIEKKLSGKSYTYNTINRLKKDFPQHEFFFLIGTDILDGIESWYKYDDLVKETKFIIYARPGFEFKPARGMNYQLVNEHRDLSSTQIRDMLKKGEIVTNLVPKEVERYIYKNNLYKN